MASVSLPALQVLELTPDDLSIPKILNNASFVKMVISNRLLPSDVFGPKLYSYLCPFHTLRPALC